jgi:hypothetical protein
MTNGCSNVSDAQHGEAIFDLLRCTRTRIRMCAHTKWSRGSICFTGDKEARGALSDSRFGVSRCNLCSQDLEALPYGKEM